MIKYKYKSVKPQSKVLEYDLNSKNDTIVIRNIPFKINTSQKVICNRIKDTYNIENAMNNLLLYFSSQTCPKKPTTKLSDRDKYIHFKLINKHHSV